VAGTQVASPHAAVGVTLKKLWSPKTAIGHRSRSARHQAKEIRWSKRSLTRHSEMSQTAIARIWKAFPLRPRAGSTFKLSNDPLFIDNVRDLVGLYLDPPARCCCRSMKTVQIQALDRSCNMNC
jgi:hypothetical protein